MTAPVPDMAKKRDTTEEVLQARVIQALEDPRYDWRTIDGVAEQTGLPRAQVRRVIESLANTVLRSSIPDDEGRALFTTRKHYNSTHGIGARLLNALADKVA